MNLPPVAALAALTRWLPAMWMAFVVTAAVAQADPPSRVGALSHTEGSVAVAAVGETEWANALVNRPVTRGDRLWTDPGGRAEVHLGTSTLHVASQAFVEVLAVDTDVIQLSLNEGAVNLRVRQLAESENVEITTPQLAFRVLRPGSYRIDADPLTGATRVAVLTGAAAVYGAGTGALQLQAGQEVAFAGRDLAPVAWLPHPDGGFQAWAVARNQMEDQSISARYVPRDVVGYQQLDAHGLWRQDPQLGPIWYPRGVSADWAPYRFGRWDFISPWGWTWIDQAPWGFAPSHYGRWAQIGSRWAWAPGPLGQRPVYAPALVVFVGASGGVGWSLTSGSSPGVAWFPLAPGEAWRPTYRASPSYTRNLNRNLVMNTSAGTYFYQRRPEAIGWIYPARRFMGNRCCRRLGECRCRQSGRKKQTRRPRRKASDGNRTPSDRNKRNSRSQHNRDGRYCGSKGPLRPRRCCLYRNSVSNQTIGNGVRVSNADGLSPDSVHGVGKRTNQWRGLLFLGRQVDRSTVDLGVISGEFSAGASNHGTVERVALALAQAAEGL